MICQNCAKNEATTHIKRIVNGEASQLHLCTSCAEHLGYADVFSGFGFNISNMLTNFFPDFMISASSDENTLRCETCGSTFEDIIRTGMMGCADCYDTFYEKLRPSLSRIHGRAKHTGKIGISFGDEAIAKNKIRDLNEELQNAIKVQNFERAAVLRDEIKELEGEHKS